MALLPDADAAKVATEAFAATATTNAMAVAAAAAAGWPDRAPYDVILAEGGIEQVPEGLKTQIRDNGRLVAIATNDRIGRAVELHKRGDVFARREAFQAAATPLPGFTEAAGFRVLGFQFPDAKEAHLGFLRSRSRRIGPALRFGEIGDVHFLQLLQIKSEVPPGVTEIPP